MNQVADAIALKLTKRMAAIWRDAIANSCSKTILDEAWRLVVTAAEREWGQGTRVSAKGTDVIVEKSKMYEVIK